MDDKLSANEKVLIFTQALYFFAGALASVFLSIYLFKLGGYPAVTLFYLLNYFMIVIMYLASGYLLKRLSSTFLIVLSLILFSFFWAALFLLRENSVMYLIPLGIWYGIGQGLFWSGLNLTQYIVSHRDRRNKYFGWLWSWTHTARGSAPVIGGMIIASSLKISLDGYAVVFFCVLILNLINVLFAVRMPGFSGVTFSPQQIFHHKRTKTWKVVLTQQFILGLWDVSVSNLFSVILFLILTDEFIVGTASAALNLLAATGAAAAPHIIRRIPRSPIAAGILSGLGLMIFANMQNTAGLIILAVLTLFGFQLVAIPASSAILSGMDENPGTWQNKYHLLIERDTVLGVARSFSFVILWLAFSSYSKEDVAPVWLTLIAVCPVVLGYLVSEKSHS